MASRSRKSATTHSGSRTRTKPSKKNAKVWERPPPSGVKHHHLAPKKKAAAKAAARRAGRPYPNLVDNIRAASPKRAK